MAIRVRALSLRGQNGAVGPAGAAGAAGAAGPAGATGANGLSASAMPNDGVSWNIANASNASATVTMVLAAATLIAVPVLLGRSLTLKRFGVREEGSAVGSSMRLGIYRGDLNTMMPTTLLVDAGAFATTVAGIDVLSADNLGIAMPAGLYFLTVNANVAGAALRAFPIGGAQMVLPMNILGAPRTVWQIASAFGALPANFPAVTYAATVAAFNTALLYAQFLP